MTVAVKCYKCDGPVNQESYGSRACFQCGADQDYPARPPSQEEQDDLLQYLYIVKGLTVPQIAARHDVDQERIRAILVRMGIYIGESSRANGAEIDHLPSRL